MAAGPELESASRRRPGHRWRFVFGARPGRWQEKLKMPEEAREPAVCKFSWLRSFGWLGRFLRFNEGYGAIFAAESFAGYAAYICLGHSFDALNLVEEFAPVAIAGLRFSKL